MDEYGNDFITVVNDEGNEEEFEVLDRIETDDGSHYIAMIPSFENEEDMLEDSGELIILKVTEEENGDNILEPIEDDDEFDEIAAIFEERLSEMFEFEDENTEE